MKGSKAETYVVFQDPFHRGSGERSATERSIHYTRRQRTRFRPRSFTCLIRSSPYSTGILGGRLLCSSGYQDLRR